jgi:hypothetical protein
MASPMLRFARVLLAAVVAAAATMATPPNVLWAQADRSNEAPPPSQAGRPGAAEQPLRFDDAGTSGAPCAVPGLCGLCDCPKPPATANPTPRGPSDANADKHPPQR